jgi:Flp pilus assembly protein TadD
VEISAHILPRRVIMALVVLLGLGLRLWGLAWGPEQVGAPHPDEWTWQVIDSLSLANPTYHGIWTQTFFSLAALLRGAISTLIGWTGVWVGEVRTATELMMPAKMAGRLAVALMGSLQVWLAYLVARRYFDSVATGILAAAVLAVNPLLVAHSHYLALDVPLGLMVMLCLWAAWQVVERPTPLTLALAGLVLGLTITTRASGMLALPVFLGAGALAWRQSRPETLWAALSWPGAFVGGLLLGLVLGYPGFVFHFEQVGDILTSSFAPPPAVAGGWWAFLAERGRAALTILGRTVGLELLLLWLAGAGLLVWRRQWQRLLLALFPPLYLLASLTTLTGSVEGQQAVWLPVAALTACWPLVVLCRRLPGRWWPVLGVSLLGMALCAWPLWRSLGVSYLFWQQDTQTGARFWLRHNLPAEPRLLAGPKVPLGMNPWMRAWDPQDSLHDLRAKADYLVVSSLAEDGDPLAGPPPGPAGDVARLLPLRLQLLKSFDLRQGWGIGAGAGLGFPRWVSPRVDVYSTLPARAVSRPLALPRPWAGSERSYAVLYGQGQEYSRGENAVWLGEAGVGQRVLRLASPPARLGLDLSNLGQDLAWLEVSQGPWLQRRLSLYPGQRAHLSLSPAQWPLMAEGFHTLRLGLRRGGSVLARIDWDPLLLGRWALEEGRYQEAVEHLGRAAAGEGGFDAQALLAGALARLGRFEEAGRALAALSGPEDEPLKTYQALAGQGGPGGPGMGQKEWDARFGALTGYYPALLRQAVSTTYLVRGPLCLSEGQEVPLSGEGYEGAFLRQAGRPGGYLKLWLSEPFPEGALQVEAKLWTRGMPAPAEELGRLEVWAHGWEGSRLLAGRSVRAAELPGGAGSLRLPFVNPRAGNKLELRLSFSGTADLRLEQAQVGVDLPAHMRSILRWRHEAWGRVSLQAGRFAQAVSAFEALLELDPGLEEAYLLLAQALSEAGRLDQAYARARRAEALFSAQPERLAKVRDLYQQLQKPQDAARVERMLGDLHPSLKREARFAGGLTLLGYDLSRGEIRRGGELEVNYYWKVWSQPPLDYYIFVHLKGPDSLLPFDHLLDHGRQPMTELSPGQVVREGYRLTIPENLSPGRYRLLVGLWDPRFTKARVPIVQGENAGGDEVTLATFDMR